MNVAATTTIAADDGEDRQRPDQNGGPPVGQCSLEQLRVHGDVKPIDGSPGKFEEYSDPDEPVDVTDCRAVEIAPSRYRERYADGERHDEGDRQTGGAPH